MAHYRSILLGLSLALLYSVSLRAGTAYDEAMGHAAWMFDSPSNSVEHIKAYAKHVPRKGMSLKLLFADAGSLTGELGPASVVLDLSSALELASLVPPAMKVYARIRVDASVAAAESLDWSALAASCFSPLQQHPELQGILLDADSRGPGLTALVRAVDALAINRVVAVAAPDFDEALARESGLLILKAFNRSAQPRAFRRELMTRIPDFLALSAQVGTPCMIGIPASATEREFEYTTAADGTKRASGVRMDDYVKGVLWHLERRCPDLEETFRGLSIWAYRPGEDAALAGSTERVSPARPNRTVYRIINLPLCR